MLWAPYKRVNRNTISEPSINLASKFCDAKSPWDSVINVEIHLRTRIPGTVWTDYRRARVCPPRVWSIFDLTNALQIRETRSRLDLANGSRELRCTTSGHVGPSLQATTAEFLLLSPSIHNLFSESTLPKHANVRRTLNIYSL